MEKTSIDHHKSMRNTMFTLLSASLLLSTFGCDSSNKEENKIRVIGEGKIRAMPDRVILTLDVSFTEPRMVDAVRKTQNTVDSVLIILSAYTNQKEDIKSSNISANKEYKWNGNKNTFVGFKAQQTIDFALNDLTKFTALTGKLLETKINSISQIQFGHTQADSLFREADLLAYDDALKSAHKLSDRSNVSLGSLLFISNDGAATTKSGNYSSYERIDTYGKGFGGAGFKISPEVLEFKRNIVAEFKIN